MSRTRTAPADETAARADLLDERLAQDTGLRGAVDAFRRRVRDGDLGMLPVVVGLFIIGLVFYLQDVTYLSSSNLVNITLTAVPYGVIAVGIVLVLLLGEIDLSVGSISGLAGSITAVLVVQQEQPLVLGLAAGAGTGAVIGIVYGLIFTKIGVPSFVITLAGLLGFVGLQYVVLGDTGTINLPRTSPLAQFAREDFLSPAVSYVVVVAVVALYALVNLIGIRRRTAAGLPAQSVTLVLIKAGVILAGLGFLTYYLNIDRGWGFAVVFFVGLVVLLDLVLRKSTWGRHLYAVGGNVEAARRSGINVTWIYISAFSLTGLLAATGGLLFLARLTSVSQASGSNDVNLTAIAAAVIGGVSLFGGRGSAYSALLGVLVLMSINSGLNRIGVDSSVRFIVTGAVLLLAVSIDAIARRARASSGRG